MQLSTLSAVLGVRKGFQLDHCFNRHEISLGGGSLSITARLDRYEQPEIADRIIMNAYPLVRGRNVFLARDRRPAREAMMVLVQPRTWSNHKAIGSLRLDLCSPGVEEIVRATGPRDFYTLQDGLYNVAWIDSLVVMWPGDFIVILTEDGRELRAQYGESGLKLLNPIQPRNHA
jgi:hypothetical protein